MQKALFQKKLLLLSEIYKAIRKLLFYNDTKQKQIYF